MRIKIVLLFLPLLFNLLSSINAAESTELEDSLSVFAPITEKIDRYISKKAQQYIFGGVLIAGCGFLIHALISKLYELSKMSPQERRIHLLVDVFRNNSYEDDFDEPEVAHMHAKRKIFNFIINIPLELAFSIRDYFRKI